MINSCIVPIYLAYLLLNFYFIFFCTFSKDINECETNNGGCEQLCTNQPGSHKCTCREGLQPDPENDKRCIGK